MADWRPHAMLYFLHIPKTGGQSLSARLATAFAPDRSFLLREDITSTEQLARLIPQHDFIAAHTGPGVLAGRLPAFDIVSAVRHPFEHMRSSWTHARRDPLNALHRPARELTFRSFATHFPDMLANPQSRSLVTTMFHVPPDVLAGGETLWTARHLGEALDRLRWVVPTEELDAFCRWWPLDSGRHLGTGMARVNVTPPEDMAGLDEVSDYARRHPEVVALDLLLWDEARRRFGAWCDRVAAGAVPGRRDAQRGDCAFAGPEGSGIWLSANWYPREDSAEGQTWWAGPSHSSGIHVRVAPGQRTLSFEVAVVLLVAPEAIVVSDTSWAPLPTIFRPLPEGMASIEVELPAGREAVDLILSVPFVGSSMQVLQEGGDPQRRSVALRKWQLS